MEFNQSSRVVFKFKYKFYLLLEQIIMSAMGISSIEFYGKSTLSLKEGVLGL